MGERAFEQKVQKRFLLFPTFETANETCCSSLAQNVRCPFPPQSPKQPADDTSTFRCNGRIMYHRLIIINADAAFHYHQSRLMRGERGLTEGSCPHAISIVFIPRILPSRKE